MILAAKVELQTRGNPFLGAVMEGPPEAHVRPFADRCPGWRFDVELTSTLEIGRPIYLAHRARLGCRRTPRMSEPPRDTVADTRFVSAPNDAAALLRKGAYGGHRAPTFYAERDRGVAHGSGILNR